MSNIGNKETMSKNLKYYIERSGKDRKELAKIWGFPYSTISEWINGRKYPRIDRIEIMADYFGILKSDLIEDKGEEHKKMLEDIDEITDIMSWIKSDADWKRIMKKIRKASESEQALCKKLLTAATESFED